VPHPTSSRVIVDGLEVSLLRKQVKYVRLHVSPKDGHVWVSMPHGVAAKHAVDFVRERRTWIEHAQQKLAERRAAAPPDLEPKVPQEVALWGEQLKLEVRPVYGSLGGRRLDPLAATASRRFFLPPAGWVWTRQDPDRLIIFVPAGYEQDPVLVDAAIAAFYEAVVKEWLVQLAARWVPLVGRQPKRWTVRRMKTRWGSCRQDTARITLNDRLAALPPEMMEQVVVHELVHLWVPNHGQEFYDRMDALLPEWRHIRRAMRQHPAA
jgi:predicted metal-dependent hydrolase